MGQAIMRLGDMSLGHTPFPPSPSIESSTNVNVNKKGAVRMGDKYQLHCSGSCHQGSALSGSTVYVNGKKVHRTQDKISCGDIAGQGSPNVKAG